jgi:hypothetical protein
MLPAHSAGHPGNYILLFFDCADSSPPTPVEYTSYLTGQGGAFSAPAGKKIQMHGKTHKYEGMRHTYWYAAMSEDAVQHSR